MLRISVITPTYNRGNVLNRVYDSLLAQTNKSFEWIVIDDGSTDDTASLMKKYSEEAPFKVIYHYQENSGKHIAVNKGVELASGEMTIIADSDDSFTPDAFEVLLKYWDMIPDNEKKDYRGVTCRCYDPDTNEKIGKTIEEGYVDLNALDASYRYGFNFEMWGINRTDLMREFPFPDTRSENTNLKFYPEGVIWDNMGRNHKARFIDNCLRAYYRDQENALTNGGTNRANENVYLWQHLINDVFDYAKYWPMRYIKAFVGISRDNIIIGNGFSSIVKKGNKFYKRLLIAIFFPAGWLLAMRKK